MARLLRPLHLPHSAYLPATAIFTRACPSSARPLSLSRSLPLLEAPALPFLSASPPSPAGTCILAADPPGGRTVAVAAISCAARGSSASRATCGNADALRTPLKQLDSLRASAPLCGETRSVPSRVDRGKGVTAAVAPGPWGYSRPCWHGFSADTSNSSGSHRSLSVSAFSGGESRRGGSVATSAVGQREQQAEAEVVRALGEAGRDAQDGGAAMAWVWPAGDGVRGESVDLDGQAAEAAVMAALEQGLGGPLSQEPVVPPPQPLVVVISGPSGVGKDAAIKCLQAARPDIHFVVTATSRQRRAGEVDGQDYIFVSREEFEAMRDAGELLEHAVVYGDYKGIPKKQVRDSLARGTDVVLRVDVQGAATMRSLLGSSAVFVFLVAETEQALVQRLVRRKSEPVDKLLVRVGTAREELRRRSEFDYVVVNAEGQLEGTVATLCSIIDAEKLRAHRPPVLEL